MTYTDQILELFKRKPAHPDPKVDRAILQTEIEDVLHKASGEDEIARLGRQIEDLEEEVDSLKDQLEEED